MKPVQAVALSIILVAAGVATWLRCRPGIVGRDHAPVLLASAASVPPARVVANDPSGRALGERLIHDEGLADSAMFLFVAAVRTRCVPQHAHDLPRMAVMAGLPVLSSPTGGDFGGKMRQSIRGVVRHLVDEAPCDSPLALGIGRFRRSVDPEEYAAAFPDSYFDPALAVPPDEFGGVALALRATDECNRVAYAVLPLDASHPWQCGGLRAAARKRIRHLCGAQPVEAAALQIRQTADTLPLTCQ